MLCLYWFLLTLLKTQKRDAPFHHTAMTISVQIWMVFVIVWEAFHGSIFLILVLLQLLLNFVSGSKLELVYIIPVLNIRLSPTRPHDFQLLVLMSYLIETFFFFHLYQQSKSSTSKVKFRQASNIFKRALEATKLAYVTETNLAATLFGKLLLQLFNKHQVNSAGC